MHRHRKEVEELRHELTHPIHSSVPYQGFFLGPIDTIAGNRQGTRPSRPGQSLASAYGSGEVRTGRPCCRSPIFVNRGSGS